MKFTVYSNNLFKNLQYFNGIINYNNPISILNNFIFKIKDNELFVRASDLEVTLTTKIDIIKYDKKGKIAVPAKLILNTLKNLPEQPITFYSENEHILNIISRYGNYTITIQDAETFPNIYNNINYIGKIILSNNTLLKIIDKTLFATGNDDFRQVMTGVFFYITPNKSIFVSTDSHKLVKYVRKDVIIDNNKIAKLIIPKKPLKILKNILCKKKEEKITIYYNESNTTFSLSNKTLICKLINGNYPNYESVIPNNNDKKLIINKNVLFNSIKRITLFSKNNQICLHFKNQTLNIIAKDIEFSNKAFETLKCDYTGIKDFKIGFNSKFLIDIISHIDGENIIFEMSKPNLAVILKPFESLEEEELLMLVMPYYSIN